MNIQINNNYSKWKAQITYHGLIANVCASTQKELWQRIKSYITNLLAQRTTKLLQ